MVDIGGMPILWHIMKMYSHYELNEFIVCCGYKGYQSKSFSQITFFIHLMLLLICLRTRWKFIERQRNHGR